MPGVVQHTRDIAEEGGRRGGRARARRDDALRRPREQGRHRLRRRRPARASSTSRSATWSREVGDALPVMSDLCLDEFTDHGHCGVLDRRRRRSTTTRTLEVYAEMARRPGRRGRRPGRAERDDGRPGRGWSARRSTPPATPTSAILAYSAKYASAFYGPFREAVDSSLQGDRRTYQQDPANARRGRPRGAARRRGGRRHRDGEAGAGLPRRGPREVREAVDVPVAAYNISGEYAMVEAAAAQRLDRPRGRHPGDAHLDPARGRRRRADLLGRRGRPAAARCRGR